MMLLNNTQTGVELYTMSCVVFSLLGQGKATIPNAEEQKEIGKKSLVAEKKPWSLESKYL
jgi:hypothetical protein